MSISGRALKRQPRRRDTESLQIPAPNVQPHGDGDDFFSDDAWAHIAEKLGLSPRQTQIVKCLLADQSDDEITRSLGVSWSTVQTHMRRLREKLGASSRIQVAMQVFAAYQEWRATSAAPNRLSVKYPT